MLIHCLWESIQITNYSCIQSGMLIPNVKKEVLICLYICKLYVSKYKWKSLDIPACLHKVGSPILICMKCYSKIQEVLEDFHVATFNTESRES